MSLPISPKIPRRFTPRSYLDESGQPKEGAPVYIIKIPSRREKLAFDHEVNSSGARGATNAQLYEALRDGIAAVVVEEDKPRLLEIVDQFEAAQNAGEPIPEDLARDMAEIQRTIRPHHPPYAQIEADREYRVNLSVIIAAQMFLIGWENVPAKFERRAGRVPDELMEQLPDGDWLAIGWEAVTLMMPTGEQSKNSASPAQSPSTPGPTQAEQNPPTEGQAGTSSASSTAETPA